MVQRICGSQLDRNQMVMHLLIKYLSRFLDGNRNELVDRACRINGANGFRSRLGSVSTRLRSRRNLTKANQPPPN